MRHRSAMRVRAATAAAATKAAAGMAAAKPPQFPSRSWGGRMQRLWLPDASLPAEDLADDDNEHGGEAIRQQGSRAPLKQRQPVVAGRQLASGAAYTGAFR